MNWKTRLTNAREAKGFNKREFAKLVGVSAPTMTDWEKPSIEGGIIELKAKNLWKVCDVLGVTREWLLHGEESSLSANAHAVGRAFDQLTQQQQDSIVAHIKSFLPAPPNPPQQTISFEFVAKQQRLQSS